VDSFFFSDPSPGRRIGVLGSVRGTGVAVLLDEKNRTFLIYFAKSTLNLLSGTVPNTYMNLLLYVIQGKIINTLNVELATLDHYCTVH